jgi:P4 family phage/plasmid primase-like protien
VAVSADFATDHRVATEQFRKAILDAGLTPPEVIVSDGDLHRFSTNGKSTDDSGWYCFQCDGIPTGVFGDWRTGTKKNWRANIGRQLSLQEEATHRDRVNAMRQQREAERGRRQAKAREQAAEIWRSSTPAPDDHAYLKKKRVLAFGLQVHEGMLVIPMYDGRQLHNLQYIAADGQKRFLTGGRVRGCYFAIGKPDGSLCIAEGYATGASVHEATGYAVAVAFSAGNLLPVAQALREKFPDLRLILCADDDARTRGNPGLTSAREAAMAVGGLIAVPNWGEHRPEGANDFNDLRQLEGDLVIRQIIEHASKPSTASVNAPPPADSTQSIPRKDSPLAPVLPIKGGRKGNMGGGPSTGLAHQTLVAGDPSEDGIALAFAVKYKDSARYCHTRGCWYTFRGTHWCRDDSMLAFSWARDICRDLNIGDFASLKRTATAAAVERAARSDRRLAVTSEIWDRDPMLCGTPDGVIDLKTGYLRPARADDYITKMTAVAPGGSAEPKLWIEFLEQVTLGDQNLIRFLQQIAGYSLTGDIREHALFFKYGAGGNGKGVFVHTLKGIWNDYAVIAPMDAFIESRGDRHPTDLAMLSGARLVISEESEVGRAWNSSRIKTLCGGDPVTARFMRQDFFTFMPTWKLILVGNHQPILRNVDEAAKRRFNIIPYNHKPKNPDRELESKLREEWPDILRWAMEGCIDWQRNGLVRPSVVTDATQIYFETQDTIGGWLEESCDIGPLKSDTLKRLFDSFSVFSESSGSHPGKSASLSDELSKRGFKRIRDLKGIRGRGFLGIQAKITQDTWSAKYD